MRPDDDIVRVLFVHTATLPPLGADTWVHSQIIAGLDKGRHQVYVACAGTADAPTPTFTVMSDIPDIDLVRVNFGREMQSAGSRMAKVRQLIATLPMLGHIARLAVYIRRHHIDVIHTSDRPRDALACVVLARLTRRPCIVHAHVGFDPSWMSPMLTWSMKRADGLVAISQYVASTLVAGGHDPSRIHVVLNALDLTSWRLLEGRDVRRAEFGYAPQDTVIVSVCRLFPAKGPADLIRALALVRQQHDDVQLLVVGQEMTPGYAAELAQLAADLGVDRHVVFTGRRNDVPTLMAAADIFAMPSLFEPFGLVYLEAMAMELPVVALDNGGTPEVVMHDQHGLLSSPGNLEQLAENLVTLVADVERRTEMGRAGRRRVLAEFTIERMAQRVDTMYRIFLRRTVLAESKEAPV